MPEKSGSGFITFEVTQWEISYCMYGGCLGTFVRKKMALDGFI